MKKITLITAIVAVFSFSCDKDARSDKGSSPVIFSVGDVSITSYELVKNRDRKSQEYSQFNNRPISNNEMKDWQKEFIDRTYLLADAYQKGYDTLEEVNIRVQNMANLIVTQTNGLLAKKAMEEELLIHDVQIDTAIARRKTIKRIQYLKTENYDLALNLFGEDMEVSLAEFEKIANSELEEGVFLNNDELVWPYFQFTGYEDYVYGLNQGELSNVIPYLGGYYVVYVLEVVNKVSHPMLDETREQITMELKKSIIDRFHIKRSFEIDSSANITYNFSTANELTQRLAGGAGMHNFDKKNYQSFLTQNLISYTLEGEVIEVSFNDFFDYYNNLVIKKDIYSLDDLLNSAESMVYLAYDLKLADELGVTNDATYLLDKDNYKKQIVFAKYLLDEVERNIEISESEKQNVYESSKEGYVQPLSIVASVYVTDDWLQAKNIRRLVYTSSSEANVSIGRLENTVSYEHLELKLGENSVLPDTLINLALDLVKGKISFPIDYNDKFYLIVKEVEKGSRVKNIEEVEDYVITEAIKRSVELEKIELIEKLKKKFELIKYDQFENYSI